jgi:uncharacterized protein YjdB
MNARSRTPRRIFPVIAVAAALGCGGSASTEGSVGASGDGGTTAADAGQAPQGLVSIALSQTDVHIPVGTTTAFAVTGTMQDGTRVDVTQQANAISSNPAVASVAHGQGSQILITASSQGSATITVSVGSLTQTCAVTVTPRS